MPGGSPEIQHIPQVAQTRKGLLRKSVKNPPAIAKLEDVLSGITSFAGTMKAYKDIGGSPPEGHELRIDFLETLPSEIREQLMWRVNNTGGAVRLLHWAREGDVSVNPLP